jgi:hypothetical protein
MPGLPQGDVKKHTSIRANRANKSCKTAGALPAGMVLMVLIGNTIRIPGFWRLPVVPMVTISVG